MSTSDKVLKQTQTVHLSRGFVQQNIWTDIRGPQKMNPNDFVDEVHVSDLE